jgi:hypothetical protein
LTGLPELFLSKPEIISTFGGHTIYLLPHKAACVCPVQKLSFSMAAVSSHLTLKIHGRRRLDTRRIAADPVAAPRLLRLLLRYGLSRVRLPRGAESARIPAPA